MAKKKAFGTNTFVKQKKRKRPGRHSKQHKGKKFSERGQGKPI
jgi:hypothetical protein